MYEHFLITDPKYQKMFKEKHPTNGKMHSTFCDKNLIQKEFIRTTVQVIVDATF